MLTLDKLPPVPLRLGVIGAGQISQIILPMLSKEAVVVTGVTDLNPAAARALAETLGSPRVHPDHHSLLAAQDVEAVYIATPPATHMALTLAALNAGKHVICEKPWMMNATEARQVAAEADRHPDLKVGCCSSRFCFTPAARVAGQKVAEKALGHLRQARVRARISPPALLENLTGWKRSSQSAGGGLAADWGVYEIEWLRSTLGPAFAPVAITASLDFWRRENSDLESSYQVTISCADNLEVQLDRTAEIGPPDNLIELRGDRAGLNVPFAPDATDKVARLYTLEADGKIVETRTDAPVTDDWNAILCGPLLNLAAAVRSGTPVAASPESQILVHEILDAIYVSGRERRPVIFTK
jgi:predicted dehydrogenase